MPRLRLKTDQRQREIVAAVLSLAGDEAAMIKRARQLFPLLLHGYRGPRKP